VVEVGVDVGSAESREMQGRPRGWALRALAPNQGACVRHAPGAASRAGLPSSCRIGRLTAPPQRYCRGGFFNPAANRAYDRAPERGRHADQTPPGRGRCQDAQVQVDGGTGQGPSGAAVDIDKLCSLTEYAKHRLDRILERHELTADERLVATVLFGAASNSQAARALEKTEHAVRAERKSIYKCLEVHDQGELVLGLAVELWHDLFVLIGPLLQAAPTPSADEVEAARRTNQLTDDQWEILEPLFSRRRRRGRPPRGRREILEAMIWFLRSDAAWRAVPARYGPWRTVYGWFRRWRDDTTLARVAEVLQALLTDAGRIDWKRWGSTVPRLQAASGRGSGAGENRS